jgi:ribonuclease HI
MDRDKLRGAPESFGMRQIEKELVLYCDGSRTGKGAEAVGYYAYVAYHGTERILSGHGEAGRGADITSNVAEYIAVLRGLEALEAAGYAGQELRVRGDSRVVMEQLGMLCAVRSLRLLPWWQKTRQAAKAFEAHFEWIPRTWNWEADRLLNGSAWIGRSK